MVNGSPSRVFTDAPEINQSTKVLDRRLIHAH
jgi:hypothetical protein